MEACPSGCIYITNEKNGTNNFYTLEHYTPLNIINRTPQQTPQVSARLQASLADPTGVRLSV